MPGSGAGSKANITSGPTARLAGQTPAERFAQRALHLRVADAQTDWEALFLSRAERRVRLDATFSLEGQLWEVPVHLRGQLIQVRFNPFDWRRVEIWWEDKLRRPGPPLRQTTQLQNLYRPRL